MLIRGRATAGWKSNLHTYFDFRRYFPDIDLFGVGESEAKQRLVYEYIAAFGPVTETDIPWWTGITKMETGQMLENLERRLARLKIKGEECDYLLIDSDLGQISSAGAQSDYGPKLLPALDPYIMGYKRRHRYLDEKCGDYVFDRSGNAAPTVMHQGQIIGVWDFDAKRNLVKTHLFRPLDKPGRERLFSQAEKMGRFISDDQVGVEACRSMVALSKRKAGGFMTPLKES